MRLSDRLIPKSGQDRGRAVKFLGLGICLAAIFGAAGVVGIQLYFDILSLLFVAGGAAGFAVMKNDPERHFENFGDGAVYFGWLGFLIGLIAIAGNRYMVWGHIEKMGPALAVAMLAVLYGYCAKLITMACGRR